MPNPKPSSIPLRWSCFVFVVSGIPAIACGPADARFTTKVASAFAPERHTVSILGVYKDGQMSSDAWGTIAPRISPALGASACEAAYADSGLSTSAPVNASMNAGLSSAIDDYARANGPTDELLARLAPAAKGDLVIVFTLAGKLPAQKPKDSPASLSTGSPTGGGALGGGPRGGHRPSFASGVDSNELDISASFFSVPQKRSVGLVAMQYSGVSVDDAVDKFSARLAQALPNARCEGWDWNAKIDVDAIRQSIDH